MVKDVRRIKLTLVFDFWCAWCYIGFREIHAAMDKCAAADLPIAFDVEYRPFILSPTLPEDYAIPRQEYLDSKFGKEKADMILKMIAERARALGINELRHGPVRSTMRAHRLVLKAYTMGGVAAQAKLLTRLFEAISLESRDVGDIDTLAELAAQVDLMPHDEAVAFLKSDELAADVTDMVDKARQEGVSGVPFTVIDGKWAISGGQTPDLYYQIFSKLAGTPAGKATECAQPQPTECAAASS